MHATARRRSPLALLGCLACLALIPACGQPVREDRTITWSEQGDSVGFQHGQEGVFVADKEGGKLVKIFQPGPEVVAVSTPLWSPNGKWVLFTTARSPEGQKPPSLPWTTGEQDGTGRVHFQHDIVITCWLCKRGADGKLGKPAAVFEAPAGHPGYVAANLAVRWHPHSDRIEYIKKIATHQHGLFEYDLAAAQSRQIFPHTSEAFLFDWAPDGSHLVCLLGGSTPCTTDGIWIGRPESADWWHVPHSSGLAVGAMESPLEALRATRPAWTADGTHFAFPSSVAGSAPQQPRRHRLYHATLATRTVDAWSEGDQPFRDLHWDPAGGRLGLVRGSADGTLHLLLQGQPLSGPLTQAPVRRFAGWSAGGKHLAYVVADEPPAPDEPWALLLLRDPSARDRVYLAPGDGTDSGRRVFFGMRVTFPQWSPREEKLSLWVTFTPLYRSLLSHLLRWGLRPGDPAAVFDPKTGKLAWMPVNAHEKVQVGHYYLFQRDYAQAWRWYQEAEQELPPPAPVVVHDIQEYGQSLQGPRDFSIFEYHCLTKLGRTEEARARLERFRRLFLPRFAAPKEAASGRSAAPTSDDRLKTLLDPDGLMGSLAQDLFVAEVFLSLDATQDGEVFLRDELKQAPNDAARLSRALVLGQVLLLERKYTDYARLSTDTIAPLLARLLGSLPASNAADFMDPSVLTRTVAELALLPLAAPELLAHLPSQQRKDMQLSWEKLQAGAGDAARPLFDHVLHGLYRSLGQEQKRQQTAAGLKTLPAGSSILPMDEDVARSITTLHDQMLAMLRSR